MVKHNGYLIITRRPGERVHIGNHVVELDSISQGVGKFSVLDPSHTFFLPPGTSIKLFGEVVFYFIELLPSRVKIGIEAPRNIKILREELVVTIDDMLERDGFNDDCLDCQYYAETVEHHPYGMGSARETLVECMATDNAQCFRLEGV